MADCSECARLMGIVAVAENALTRILNVPADKALNDRARNGGILALEALRAALQPSGRTDAYGNTWYPLDGQPAPQPPALRRHAVNAEGDCVAWCMGCRDRVDHGLPLDYEPPALATAECRCGSGLHPRRCAIHPERYQQHCDEISAEATAESGGNRLDEAFAVTIEAFKAGEK